jgi:hypothetical protein
MAGSIMSQLARTLPLLLLAACDDAPPEATLKEVPAAFLGQWDASLSDCRMGGGSALALSVAPTELRFADSTIAVTGVAPDGEHAARIDGRFTTQDATWDGAVRLELAGDGKELNVVNGATLSPRVKCP